MYGVEKMCMSYSQQLHKGSCGVSFVYMTGTLWKEFKTHTFSMWIFIILSKRGLILEPLDWALYTLAY